MRQLWAAVLLVLLLLLSRAAPAGASETWCDTDPDVVVMTPRGNQVDVPVSVGALGLVHLPAVQQAAITYWVEPARNGTATLVHLEVTVANDAIATSFPTRASATANPGGAHPTSVTTSGVSGHPMHLDLMLEEP